MARDHVLMYALSAIVLLNIVAIVLLNNRLADQELERARIHDERAAQQAQAQGLPPPAPSGAVGVPGSRQNVAAYVDNRTMVRAVLLRARDCPSCFDIGLYVAALNGSARLAVEDAAQQDVSSFAVPYLPAIAFNESLRSYPALLVGWDQVGYNLTIPSGPYQGFWYVLPTQNPPYFSLKDNQVHGVVSVIYLTYNACAECYDAHIHRDSLNASHVTYTERDVDVDSLEGKAIIKKYNITAVPTIILDEQAKEYANLQPGWHVVGSIENDSTYILRDLRRAQVVFYDLEHKKLMKP